MKRAQIILSSLFLMSLSPLAASEVPAQAAYVVVEDLAALPILNPALAERRTEKLVLANGLEVYLVSDPGVEQSAAGLAVEAGSWKDPKEYPGLAHFLEHMLFMGNEAYPKEFEYMQFITDHGGTVNAYTASDRTVYMFSINNDAYAPALDRFSHFFIDPLFLPNCINRELHAVDQEHAKNIEHDGWRQYMILKETGNANHPNSSFSTGNAQTLSGIPQEALKNWYRTNYSSNRMHLVMISPMPLDKMRELAIQDFSKVAAVEVPDPNIQTSLLSSQQKGHMIFIKPVRDIKQLSLAWEVPSEFALDIDRKAPELVAYVLEQEGENSLISELKEEKLAESIHVSCDRFSKDTLLFSIDVSLTDFGVAQVNTAIARIYQAIARLKQEGIPKYLFDEIQTISEIDYQYQSRSDAFSTVIRLTDDLVYEDIATFPEKTKIPTIHDPNFIASFIDSLKAEDCVYFVLANPTKTGVSPDVKEQWMGAEYAIKEIPASRLTAWDSAKVSPKILLPQENPFLPTQFDLVQKEADTGTADAPLLLFSNDGAQIYFAQDSRYQVPEIASIFTFKSPLIDPSPKSQVLTDLYLRALQEKLSSTLFFSSSAKMHTGFSSDELSIKMMVQGFNDKAPLLLHEIFGAFKEVAPTKEQFEIYKASLASSYDNASKELPLRQANEVMDNIIFNKATNAEKWKSIQSVGYEEFLSFSKNLFAKTYTQAMLYGNLTTSQANTMWQDLHATLKSKPYPLTEQAKKKVLILSNQYGPYMLSHQTDRQGNGVMLLIEEGSFTFEKRSAQQILGSALSDAFFDTLRTKQQTAYIAKAIASEKERQLLQYFAVQSSTHYPIELLARFELFLEDFNKNLNQVVSKERFENMRANTITVLQMPPENMLGMVYKLNELAFEYGDFDWINRRIQSCKELSYERFCELSRHFLSRDNPRRLAVLMEGVLPPENDFHYELISKEDIHSLGSFVSIK
ncbi:MAG: insulinase family protein [Parachlamydiales bacterium]|nr:insulinase family protein [Verrucomicrobiota bacterium]MBX3718784.1 insulinase family protein [Candidatus Acheromyda pituitae]